MATNGDAKLAVRRPVFPEFEDLWDLVRFDRRWPFMLGSTVPAARTLSEGALAPVDVFEKDGKVVVKAEMPGIESAKIEVNVVGGELRISGERNEESEVKEEHYYRSERRFGRIYRSIALPEGCDVDHIDAKVRDGVLEVVIPKKQIAAAKKVEVNAV